MQVGDSICIYGRSSFRCSQELCQVRQILQNDYQGGLILKNYIKTKLLSRKSANTVVDIIISELLKDYDRRMESHPRLVVNKKRLAFPTLPTHLHISYHPNPTPRLDPEYPHPNPPASMYILCNYLVNSSSLSIVISFEER
ncbi:hypothetical protein PV328_001267 [Microctonus aethiopoides]|uniref:Uncharacterized protein n=1 Tax=Microctonus aethiopoides TaxID=144406 RepID=A0AA39KXB2_9HYME|nr:hypothetical protein PV328_001267 [Microctonus aethiopoides]